MKTRHFLLVPIFVLAAISLAGCGDKDELERSRPNVVSSTGNLAAAVTPVRAAEIIPAAPATSVESSTVVISTDALAATAAIATASWNDVASYTYAQRAELAAGLKRLESKLETQIAELKAKRATMTTSTKEWDFAMKEMDDSRSYLKSMIAELNAADTDTWNEKKEKVRLAWARTQDAYAKVKASTTT